MASSSYYWSCYREKLAEAREHERNWKALKKIKDDLDGDFDNNVRDVNKKLSACGDELTDGVRHVPSVNERLSELEEVREPYPASDGRISSASGSLWREISDLQRKQQDAEQEAARFKRLAEEAEKEEWAAMFSSLF